MAGASLNSLLGIGIALASNAYAVKPVTPSDPPGVRILKLGSHADGQLGVAPSCALAEAPADLWQVRAPPGFPLSIRIQYHLGQLAPRITTIPAPITDYESVSSQQVANPTIADALLLGLQPPKETVNVQELAKVFGILMPASGTLTFSVASPDSCVPLTYSITANLPASQMGSAETFVLLVGVVPTDRIDVSAVPSVYVDLARMKKLLTRDLPQALRVPESNVLVLGAEGDPPPSSYDIAQAIVTHLGRANYRGSVILYFSGHGTILNWNVPLSGVDNEDDSRDQAWLTDDGYLIDDEVGILFGNLAAANKLVIVDSCHSEGSTLGAALGPDSGVIVKGEEFRKTQPKRWGQAHGAIDKSAPSMLERVSQPAAQAWHILADDMHRPWETAPLWIELSASSKHSVAFGRAGALQPSIFTGALASQLPKLLHDDPQLTFGKLMQYVQDEAIAVSLDLTHNTMKQEPNVNRNTRELPVSEFFLHPNRH